MEVKFDDYIRLFENAYFQKYTTDYEQYSHSGVSSEIISAAGLTEKIKLMLRLVPSPENFIGEVDSLIELFSGISVDTPSYR